MKTQLKIHFTNVAFKMNRNVSFMIKYVIIFKTHSLDLYLKYLAECFPFESENMTKCDRK
jgi:hypothetical protein